MDKKDKKYQMDKDFEIEACGLGRNYNSYPGSFTNKVRRIILDTIGENKKVLHLFSGVSDIGQVRVDLTRPEATDNVDVMDFITNPHDHRTWDFVIADPPYAIKSAPDKLKVYGDMRPFTGNVPFQRAMSEFLLNRAKNVLWLDMNAPLPKGFKRKKMWVLLPGGWHHVRVLSHLVKKDEK